MENIYKVPNGAIVKFPNTKHLYMRCIDEFSEMNFVVRLIDGSVYPFSALQFKDINLGYDCDIVYNNINEINIF